MALIPLSGRPIVRFALLASICLFAIAFLFNGVPGLDLWRGPLSWFGSRHGHDAFDWRNRPMKHPMADGEITHLPEGPPRPQRRVQHDFSQDAPPAEERARKLESRRRAVRNSFRKAWESYKQYAWGYDELQPVALRGVNTFAGWAATLVDSLDVLWIMGLEDDFREAVQFVAAIDWDRSTASSCSVFETNIRYMGGLLAAHDISGDGALLAKALELGHMLLAAFDTENHLPVNTFYFGKAKAEGARIVPSTRESSANVGSLSLEFIRLAQLTGDARFFSVVDRIKRELERTQRRTALPGMWPRYIDLRHGFLVEDAVFTLNAPADSLYEYLAKTHVILGGRDPAYERMYRLAMDTARDRVLFRPVLPGNPDVLMVGVASVDLGESGGPGNVSFAPDVQHLGCFAGAMFLLGGRLFGVDADVVVGERLALGCAWAYNATATGIMPEQFSMLACSDKDREADSCDWADHAADWSATGRYRNSLPGFTSVRDTGYVLRPEAIESLFYLYRVTGRPELQDIAWDMFLAVRDATETELAFSAITDVTAEGETSKTDSMESFFLAETLKYFYLIFSDPDVISLDDYVLNTEAHPFKISVRFAVQEAILG